MSNRILKFRCFNCGRKLPLKKLNSCISYRPKKALKWSCVNTFECNRISTTISSEKKNRNF